MGVFEKINLKGHEGVYFFNDSSTGLNAIVAIHNTTLGPALGGTRMWPYASEAEALEDCLRLSRGMTYKAAVSGLNLGGGKAVIIGDPTQDKSEALFRAYGRFIESLGGRYITAEDVNITVEDIDHIYTETSNVVGVAKVHGGSGNPAPYTALGTYKGIEASALAAYGNQSLRGKVVVVQGVGSVGFELIKLLTGAGAKVLFTDISEINIERTKEYFPNAEYVEPHEVYSLDCDIYAPCALGATINDETVDQLKCKVVAGCANNQLKESRHGEELKKRGILYAPDYLINAGGLMNVSIEFEGWNETKATRMVNTIFDTTLKIFDLSNKNNLPVNEAANLLAERRIDQISKIKNSYIGQGAHRFPGRRRYSLNGN